MKRFALATILAFGLSGSAFADDSGISVTGTGSVSAPPDCAQLVLSVISQNKDAGVAYKAVKANTEDLNTKLAAIGVDPRNVSTIGFDFNQTYDDKRQSSGWQVDHRVLVKIKNVNNVGKVIDGVAGGGKVNISSLTYDLENRDAAVAKARDAAIANAQAKADQLAKGFKASVGSVKSVVENNQRSERALYGASARADAAGGAGVQAGELTITVTLNVTFNINPQVQPAAQPVPKLPFNPINPDK